VHVPAEDNTAEAKAFFRDAEKLLLRHELAAQHAIDVYAGDLDGLVILEELGEGLGCDFGGVFGVGHGGDGARGSFLGG